MFPGATADRDDADYVVVGAPLDVSTSFQPGTRFGPNRIRKFAETYDDYDHTTDQFFSELGVHDAGDVRAWDDAVPVTVGGEHTVSAAGVAAADPDVFVCLDAHLDLRADYDGNEWSHAAVTRRILDGWPDGGSKSDAVDDESDADDAAATADEAIILGARTGSPEEWERAEDDDVTVVAPEDVADWTPDFDDDTTVYLSVDIDAADPGFAPGTGTMEPFGLTPRELRDVVRAVAPYAVGFDVVEVNDRDDGQAAALGGKLLREFVFSHAESR